MAILISTSMLSLLLAFLFASRSQGHAAAPERGAWNERIEAFVRQKVATCYVDELPEDKQRDAFYRAMDAYLDFDFYCDFIPPSEHERLHEQTEGRYAGLGIRINAIPEGLHVVGVYPDGPAAKGGIRIGDSIVRADGQSLAGLELDQVTGLLKGKPGQPLRVGFIRGPRPESGPHTGPERDVVVMREIIRPPTVFTRRLGSDGQFALVRLTDFAEETAKAFDAEMDKLLGSEPCKGLVVDLRHNGGGVLNVAVRVADRFLRPGRIIVRMEGRGMDASKNYPAQDRPGKLLDLPLVLLVDGTSASASEVVAGALQDHRRGVLVGERTYGKFLVQSIMEIPGENASVKLTTSRYYTPTGRSYQGPARGERLRDPRPEGAGLVPDVVIPLSDEDALRLRKVWENEEGGAWGEGRRHDDVPADWIDPQLDRALKLLQGEVVLQRINRADGPRNG
jgi:carboxyl-terminal processing protease